MFRYIGIDALVLRGRDAVGDAVTASARQLRDKVENATPIDEGDLAASARVRRVRRGARSATAQVASGDSQAPYAIIVHENHHDGGGGAKHVEGPLLRHAGAHRGLMMLHTRRKF